MNSAPTAVAFRAAIQLGGTRAPGLRDPADVELDAERRGLEVPPDLVDALADDGEAGWRFADASYDDQRRLVRSIARTTTGDTRRRRIATTVETLRMGRI